MSTKPKSFLDRTVCPGCGWIAPDNATKADKIRCPRCEYELNVEPYRMETVGELLRSDANHYCDVALGRFLRSVFKLARVEIPKRKNKA